MQHCNLFPAKAIPYPTRSAIDATSSGQASSNSVDSLEIDALTGAIRSRRYSDVYRSVGDALEEAWAVFVEPGWAHLARRFALRGPEGDAGDSKHLDDLDDSDNPEDSGDLGDPEDSGNSGELGDPENSGNSGELGDPENSGDLGDPEDLEDLGPSATTQTPDAACERTVSGEADSHRPARSCVEVLELGFGLGTNLTLFLECWAARLREASQRGKTVETLVFHSIEAHPLEVSELRRAWQQLLQAPCPAEPLVTHRIDGALHRPPPNAVEPDFSGRSSLTAVRRGLPAWIAVLAKDRCYRLPGLHRFELLPGFFLDLHVGDATQALRQCGATPQVVLMDGFAPRLNPQMWNEKLLRALRRLLPVDALLLSYSTAPGVLASLASLDFRVILKSRTGRKRHRLEALYRPRGIAWQLARAGGDPGRASLRSEMLQRVKRANNNRGPRSSLGHMVILGAGLAGRTLAAEALSRGWSVVLLDPRSAAEVEACALPAYLEHLHLSPDDNPLARLTRAALLLGRRSMHDAPLHIGRVERLSGADADRWTRILAQLRERSDLSPDPWEELLALHTGRVPPALHLLRAAALPLPPLARAFQREALPASLQHEGDAWRVIDGHGALLAEGDVIVGACAPAIGLMCPPLVNRLHCTPGASVVLDLKPLASGHPVWKLDALVSGRVQVVRIGSAAEPTRAPYLQIGALHEDAPGEQVHARLLEGLRETLGLDAGPLDELCRLPFRIIRGDRFSVCDHLPMIGASPDLSQVQARYPDLQRNARLPWPRGKGAFLLSALGSRGVLWSRLGARLILDELEGLPPIIARDLCAAVDPARFLIRAARKGVGHNPVGHV